VGQGELSGPKKPSPFRERRKGERRHGHGKQIEAGHNPLVGLLLDTDEVIMRESVGTRVVAGFHSGPPIPDHHVQDRNSTAQGRKSGQEVYRKCLAPARGVSTHRWLTAPARRFSRSPPHISNKVYG
jgi:hypothetical protein